MAVIFGVVGVVVGGAIVHGNHSDYSCHSRHSNYREYGDSALRNQISNKENEVNRKASDVENLRQRMNSNFNSRVNELKREKNYSGLSYSPDEIISDVKRDMQRELDKEISRDKQELAEIDKIIARINELELQAKKE